MYLFLYFRERNVVARLARLAHFFILGFRYEKCKRSLLYFDIKNSRTMKSRTGVNCNYFFYINRMSTSQTREDKWILQKWSRVFSSHPPTLEHFENSWIALAKLNLASQRAVYPWLSTLPGANYAVSTWVISELFNIPDWSYVLRLQRVPGVPSFRLRR